MPMVREVRRQAGLAELAQKRGLRLTTQRRLIFSILESAPTHLNAKQILEEARKKDPGIDQVTVYRNLSVMKRMGVIDELDLLHLRGEEHYYEVRQLREHCHVGCLSCGQMFEFYTPAMKAINKALDKECQFSVAYARIEIGGYCSKCREKEVQGKVIQKGKRVRSLTAAMSRK